MYQTNGSRTSYSKEPTRSMIRIAKKIRGSMEIEDIEEDEFPLYDEFRKIIDNMIENYCTGIAITLEDAQILFTLK